MKLQKNNEKLKEFRTYYTKILLIPNPAPACMFENQIFKQ